MATEENPTEREGVESLPTDELQEEYADLQEQHASSIITPEEDGEIYDRKLRIWRELRERAEVEQPKCPDCGGRSWGQNIGEPIHCNECGKEGVQDDDLRAEIHESWQVILNG